MFSVGDECLLTNEPVCCFEIAVFSRYTSHLFKRIVWSDEIKYHRETFAVVFNALFTVIQLNRNVFDVSLMHAPKSLSSRMSN